MRRTPEGRLFVKQIAKLIDLKSIVTIALIGASVYGFLVGRIEADVFIPIVMAVITYYFTKKE